MPRIRSALLLAALLALVLLPLAPGQGAVTAAGHEPPYNPQPLLEKAGTTGSGAYTFAVFGDSYAAPALEDLLHRVAQQLPTLAITTGDMVFNGSQSGTWRTLSTRGGWFFDNVPTWPVIGNHELQGGKGLAAFEQFYGLTSPDYSFRFRNAKFIVLDHKGDPAPARQLAFLRKELADRAQYDHVFVFRHSPFYTIGSKSREEVPDEPTAMTKLFEEYRVTAVFSGHDHIYYRTRRNGINYIIAGSAGAPVYALLRLREGKSSDAYMGRSASNNGYVLHSPTVTVSKATFDEHASPDKWLFTVMVHVDGKRVTAETISSGGTLWDQFRL